MPSRPLLSDATRAVEAAIEEANTQQANISVIIVDMEGNIVTTALMDAAPPKQTSLADYRARSATTSNFTGGKPLMNPDNPTEHVGAVGVSGADEEICNAIAAAAKSAFETRP